MAKITMKQFSDWLGLSPESITLAKQIVEVSDPDGAYTHLQDMGEEEAAEAVELIYFEHGSLKDAIAACKEDLGLIESNSINEGIDIKMIDHAISNEKDSAKKNKLTKIRGNVLNKQQLNKSETNFVKQYGIVESVNKTIKLTELRSLVKNILKEEKKQLNEISSDTFKNAVKKSIDAGSDKRTDRLSKLYFDKFIGYNLLGGRIKEILTVGNEEIAIVIDFVENVKPKTLYYAYVKDDFSHDDKPIDRKSAVILSKIFRSVNPDTKYKSVGSAFKLSDNFVESKTIKLSEVRELVRKMIMEENEIDRNSSFKKHLENRLKEYATEKEPDTDWTKIRDYFMKKADPYNLKTPQETWEKYSALVDEFLEEQGY